MIERGGCAPQLAGFCAQSFEQAERVELAVIGHLGHRTNREQLVGRGQGGYMQSMIDRALCESGHTYFLPWPCPACGQGTLEREDKMVKHWPAMGVAPAIDEGYLMPFDAHGSFAGVLKCSNKACSQGVAVFGDFSSIETVGMAFEHQYSVRGFHPALKIIQIPERTPQPIAEAITRSFHLFWSDHQACAGAIRVGIEGIVEHLGQPSKVGRKFVPLGRRLKCLKATHTEIVDAAEAIKDVGNDGAHGDKVDQTKLLDCYELLEIELRRLFNDDDNRRRALIENIRK